MAKRANGEGTICRRKDGLWMTAVTIGRDIETGKPIRKYCYGKTKGEVQQKKDALLERSKGPVFIDADKITVGQWVEKWLTIYAKASVRGNTYIGYRSVVNNHILPLLSEIKLQKLRGIDIQNMVNTIKDNGGGPRLAELTFAVLRAALYTAFNEDILQRLPFKTVSLPKKKKRKRFVPLSSAQWGCLFAAAKDAPEIFTALSLEWATGISRSELLGLKWIDFDFSTDTVIIQRADIITDDGPELNDPKTDARERLLPLPEVTIHEIKQHQARQTAAIAAIKEGGRAWEDNDLVFPNSLGKLQDPRNWSKRFQKIVKQTDLPITFHKLRHDHASRLSANGVGIKDAQYRLGHSTMHMLLNVYTHRISGGQEQIAAWLNTSYPTAPITYDTPLQ